MYAPIFFLTITSFTDQQDIDHEDANIKKFKKMPRGAFLPKISLDPQIPLKMIDRDMKDLRRFNHIEMLDQILVRFKS